MWWTFNCADFDQFQQHLPRYIDTFIDTYRAYGGPPLDKDLFRDHAPLLSIAFVDVAKLSLQPKAYGHVRLTAS